SGNNEPPKPPVATGGENEDGDDNGRVPEVDSGTSPSADTKIEGGKAAGLENIRDRESVLKAFNEAFAAFEAYPEENLTQDQIASRDLIKEIKAKTIDRGQDTYTYRFKLEDGRRRQQKEGIPIGSLQTFLKTRIMSGELSAEEAAQYLKWDTVLLYNSRDYYYPNSRKDEEKRLARIQSEANRIAKDSRLDTGSENENYKLAGDILNRRRELVLPSDKPRIPKDNLPKKPKIVPDEGERENNHDNDWSNRDIDDALKRDEDNKDDLIDKVRDRISKRSIHDPITSFYPRNISDADIENMLHGWWVGNPNDISDWNVDDALDYLWSQPTNEGNPPNGPTEPPAGPGSGSDGPQPGPNNGGPDGTRTTETQSRNGNTTEGGGQTPEGRNTNETLPPAPTTPLEELRREFYIVNRAMDIRKKASEMAEEQIQREQRRGNILNPLNWLRKSRMRIFEEYYRQVYIDRATKAMIANNNSYLDMNLTKKAAKDAEIAADHQVSEERAAGQAKIEQLKTGEHIYGQNVKEATGAVKTALLNEIIKPIVNGDLKEYAQVQEKLRAFVEARKGDPQIKEMFGSDANQFGRQADYFATDLLEMGNLVKQDIDANKYALEQIDQYVSIKLANTDWGAEATRYNVTDKLANYLQNKIPGGFLKNPATAGAITSIAFYGAFRAAGYAGRAATFIVPGSGILTGAVIGAVRRNYDLKLDRASHQVARAYNFEIKPKSHNREALEKFAYNTASVNELIDGKAKEEGADESATDTRGIRELIGLDLSPESPKASENRDALMRKMAEIRTRLDVSSEKSLDLVTFSGTAGAEQGRLALIKGIVEAKQALLNAGMTADEIKDATDRFSAEWKTKFTTNIEEQDKAFNRYRLGQSIKAGAFGSVAGAVGGLVLQPLIGEAFGLHGGTTLGDVRHHTQGIRDQVPHVGHGDGVGGKVDKVYGATGITRMAGDVRKFVGDALGTRHHNLTPEHTGNMGFDGGAGEIHKTIGGNDISIPHGTELVNNGGHYDLIAADHPDHTLISNVVGADGRVNLNAAGAAGEIHSQVTSQDVLGPSGEWAKNSTNITRQWYGNNTPFSDRNELRVDNSIFTAANGQKGVDFDMSRMMGASFQNGNSPESINVAQALAQGKMGISFTTDDNPQNALFIAFDARGHLKLDPTDFTHHINADPNSMTQGKAAQILLNQNRLAGLNNGPLESELFNHRDVFNLSHGGKPGAFEVGELVDGGPSGHRLNVLATGLGTGRTPDTINTTHFVIDVNKIPGLPEAAKHGGERAPIIATPYTPRHTLERMDRGDDKNAEPIARQPRPGETLEQAGGIIEGLTAQERIPAYTISETENEKSKELLDKVEIHGDEFDGKTLTRETLEQEGLGPKHEITVEGGPTFYMSDPYVASGGRTAFVGYVEKDGKLLARTYYRSGSQGVFRYLPGYTTDDMGNIDWFSKGFGEESITLPIYIQEGLANISTSTQPKTVTDPNLIFAGTARDIKKQTESGNTYVTEVESTPLKLEGNFFPQDPRTKIKPEDLTFANEGDGPNFAESLRTWNQSNNIYGNYTSQVFISRNKLYKYIFNQDQAGNVWIGAIENNSPIQSTGLRQSWVTGGDLLTPAYEYESQSFGFGNNQDRKGQYVDMFTNYLSKIPVIREYIESKTQPRPAPIPTPGEITENQRQNNIIYALSGDATPIEAVDNTSEAVRLGVDKKLDTATGEAIALGLTTEQLMAYLRGNPPPETAISKDRLESLLTQIENSSNSNAQSGSIDSRELMKTIIDPILPAGWQVYDAKFGYNGARLEFERKRPEPSLSSEPTSATESAIPLDPEEAELGEKLYELLERLDLERPEKEAITRFIEEDLPLGLGELLSESSQEEVVSVFEDSILALKGKTKEEIVSKESTSDIPAITGYIKNVRTMHGDESALRAERILLHIANSSPRIKGLLESSDEVRSFHVISTIYFLSWEYFNAREPKTETTTPATGVMADIIGPEGRERIRQDQIQTDETTHRPVGEIMPEALSASANTAEAIRLDVDKKLETTVGDYRTLRFTTEQLLSYLRDNPPQSNTNDFENQLLRLENAMKMKNGMVGFPELVDTVREASNPLLPAGWRVNFGMFGSDRAEINFARKSEQAENLESSTPAPEGPVTEEQKAALEEMVRQLPPELQEEVGRQQNDYQRDFAPLIRAIENGSIAGELASPARRAELQGAATIVQRETANIPELNEYYRIVEQNKDNADLVAGLDNGVAIVMDETAKTPRLEQSQDGPKIHMSLATASLLVGRESAKRVDEVIQRIERNEPLGVTATEFIANTQSMLEIIRGRDQTNQA
ncbi:MAG TPA: hypothetical protein VG917_05615, partial [Patescibacteria group bacterium]|nr:hypothetical protein [Patescibacteria group bacterium]